MARRLMRVNAALHTLGQSLWNSIPYMRIDTALQANGFTLPAYDDVKTAGENTRIHAECGEGKYLTMTWYRHESGRYEVVAYVN
jgi:hypothetical protein